MNLFLWEVNQLALNTRDRLEKNFPDIDSRCPLCEKYTESIEHLFLQCEFSKALWGWLAEGFGIHLPVHSSIKERIQFWYDLKWNNDLATWYWDKFPKALWWSVWEARNNFIFRKKKAEMRDTFMATMLRIRFWGQTHVTQRIRAEDILCNWVAVVVK